MILWILRKGGLFIMLTCNIANDFRKSGHYDICPSLCKKHILFCAYIYIHKEQWLNNKGTWRQELKKNKICQHL
jgi:hypothetical protein